jgi:hypothetical protein
MLVLDKNTHSKCMDCINNTPYNVMVFVHFIQFCMCIVFPLGNWIVRCTEFVAIGFHNRQKCD